MARKHALLISLAVACALVAGVFAAVRTTELGASASTGTGLSDRQLTTRDRQLDKIAKRIRAHARKRPPKLPGLRMPVSSGSRSSGSLSSGPGPGPQVLVSNSGPGLTSSGHHDDHFDDHGHDDHDDEREDRLDDAADAAEDRADELEDAREDARDHD